MGGDPVGRARRSPYYASTKGSCTRIITVVAQVEPLECGEEAGDPIQVSAGSIDHSRDAKVVNGFHESSASCLGPAEAAARAREWRRAVGAASPCAPAVDTLKGLPGATTVGRHEMAPCSRRCALVELALPAPSHAPKARIDDGPVRQ
jgi:hypothetical protein